MIESSYYLTEPGALDQLLSDTELCKDEIESIVGRFRKNHWRFAGLLKGEVIYYTDGKIIIRHHFTKKKLWELL